MNTTSNMIVSLIDGTFAYSLDENENDLDLINICLPNCDTQLRIYTGMFYYNDFVMFYYNDFVAVVKAETDKDKLTADLNRQIHLLKFIPTDKEIEIHAQIPESLLRSADHGSRHALKAVGMVLYELIKRYQLAIPHIVRCIGDAENG